MRVLPALIPELCQVIDLPLFSASYVYFHMLTKRFSRREFQLVVILVSATLTRLFRVRLSLRERIEVRASLH
jgi:hypothetical protein